MKTGIVRKIDDLGRVVIPREIRRRMNIREGDPLEISIEGNKIAFELYIPSYKYEDYINKIAREISEDDEFTDEKAKVLELLNEAAYVLRTLQNDEVRE